MSSQTKSRYTPEEYLAIERGNTEQKNEYYAGEIFAMGRANEWHNLIVTNIVRELGIQTKGSPCKVYSNDMRVKVDPTGLYTYPDIVALCNEARFDDEQRDTLLNPTVIIEVLSKSTEGYDRGEKFEHYRKLESLAEYLLVSQDKHHVDHYVRQLDNQWLLSETYSPQVTVQLPSIKCNLALAEIYDKVEISTEWTV